MTVTLGVGPLARRPPFFSLGQKQMRPKTVREFNAGISKIRHGLIVSGGLALLGLGILVFAGEAVPGSQSAGLLVLGLSAVVAIFVWRNNRDRGVQLRVDGDGIWYKGWGLTVPWRQIEAVLHTGHRFQPFVSIRIRDPEKIFGGQTAGLARKLQADRLWKESSFRIPNGAVDATQAELLEILRAALEENR